MSIALKKKCYGKMRQQCRVVDIVISFLLSQVFSMKLMFYFLPFRNFFLSALKGWTRNSTIERTKNH